MSGLFLIVNLKTCLSVSLNSLTQLKSQPFFLVAFLSPLLIRDERQWENCRQRWY